MFHKKGHLYFSQIFTSFSVWPIVLIGLFLRLVNINAPVLGVHSWRQADTAAMARHFANTSNPIWLPQIDWSGAGHGFVESEFPLYPYIVGQIYKITGIHEWIGRSFSIFLSAITIFLVIRIGSLLIDTQSGLWAGFFFSVFPLSIYYGRTFQAESLLLFLSVLSLERLIS